MLHTDSSNQTSTASTHRTFYKNTAWQFGLQIVKYIFPLITLPYLTRVLEPDGYAVYAYVVSFMMFVQTFVDFGFNLSGTKQIAKSTSVDEENRIIGSISQARLILCSIAAAIVFIIALLIPITAANLGYTMLAFIAICGKAMVPDFIFQGHENMGPLTTRFFVSKSASTLLTFVFVHSVNDIIWIPILDIFSSAIALAWSFVAAKRMFGTTISIVAISEVRKEIKRSALYCFSNMAASVFTGFTTLLIGVVVTDAAEISYWSLAMTAMNAAQSLYAPIINSLYPHMVNGMDLKFVKKLALVALPIVCVGTVLFALLSKPIMLVLGGKDYLIGSWVIVAISPILPFSFFATLQGWPILGAVGKVKELTTSTIGTSLFCIAALIITSILGYANLFIICIIRVVTEIVLCLSRTFFLYKTLRNSQRQQ